MNKYLFFVTQNYSFEILRPIQKQILARGDDVAWFLSGKEVNLKTLTADEKSLATIEDVISYNADANFVPGNKIPDFFPGIKVQVFHGLEWKKQGHFDIRGHFDLYCTHGPATTSRFNQLAAKYKYFQVRETGWSKLDTLFSASPYHWPKQTNKPIILFAPTFSPNLTSAPALIDEIKRLSEQYDWQWLVKFHPKMNKQWVKDYQQIENENLTVVDVNSVNGLLQVADILVSDTSSIIGEFSLLNKPCVTLNNSKPGNYLIDIDSKSQLEAAILQGLDKEQQDSDLLNNIKQYALDLHPFNDGMSSARILDATEELVTSGLAHLKPKPLNLFRKLKMRKKLGYWKF